MTCTRLWKDPPFRDKNVKKYGKWRDLRGKIAQKCVFGYDCHIFWKSKKTRHDFGDGDNAPADLMAQGAKNEHNSDILCGFFHTGYC
jgi:hypothetical protein